MLHWPVPASKVLPYQPQFELLTDEEAEKWGADIYDRVTPDVRDLAQAIVDMHDAAPRVRGINRYTGEIVEGPVFAVVDTLLRGMMWGPDSPNNKIELELIE